MYRSEVTGLGGIEAKVVADSIFKRARVTTLELKYPRFIHAEFMTHRVFSRNASSSRAIPVERMLENVTAMPIHWGKNQSGMQAREECSNPIVFRDMITGEKVTTCEPIEAWALEAESTSWTARMWSEAGYHKQIVNRLTEPFQFISVVVTATEWDNFFNLRLHPDAQPEIQELAKTMKEAMKASKPVRLVHGTYHLPYWEGGYESDPKSLRWAISASVARCARVSFKNHDNSNPDLKKDIELADMLLESKHMSPFEHQARPMTSLHWEDGVTHRDRFGNYWSGNFKNFIQYRQLIGE